MIFSRLLMTLIIAIMVLGPLDQITATPAQKADSLLFRLAEVSEDSLRIEILTELGLVFRAVDPEKSRMWYERADSLASGSGNDKQRIRIYSGRGRLEANAGDNQQALLYFNWALDIARKAKQIELEAENLVNLGIMHKRVGNYPQSTSHYLQALTIYSQLNDRQGISRTYQNLGVVTDLSGDLDKAMAYYESAIEIEQELERTIDLGSIYNNMAIIEYKRKNLTVATDMMKISLHYYKSSYSQDRWIPVYINLGNFLIKDNIYRQALAYLDTASMLTQQFPDLQSETNLAYNYSEAWLGLRDVQKAHAYAQKNLELALKLGGVKHVADAYQLSSKVYESMGDTGQALESFKLYKQFNDSLFNETRNRELANFEVQLDVFSKNQLIAEQQVEMLTMNQEMMREKRLRRLFFIIAMLSVTVIYLLVRQFLKNKQVRKKLEKQNKIITNQKQHIEHTNQILEQKLLRSQINPHFVFNALSSIQHLITSGEKTEALGYLSRFSRLLRQVLDGSAETNVLLAEEINMLKAYIELEALRFGHSFSFSIKVDPKLDTYSYEVPALLVQPIIENAIIHGLMPLKKERLLAVAFFLGDDEIICTVEDNGVGRKEALRTRSRNSADHKSYGLNITTQRINHLVNDQRETEMLVYTDLFDPEGNPAGTRVRVVIPVHS
jgi:tetratricopeptide (TPR) repeat protein